MTHSTDMPQIDEQLKGLKKSRDLQPRRSWSVHTRDQVLAHARQTSQSAKNQQVSVFSHFIHDVLPARIHLATRSAFVFILAFGLVTGGLVATASPLPRDFFVNVKIAVASATGQTELKAQLHLEEAAVHTQRISIIDEEQKKEGKEPDIKKIQKQVKKIKKHVESATKSLETLQERDTEKAKDVAKNFTQQTKLISDHLKEVSKDVKEQTSDDTQESENEASDVAKELVEARKAVKNTTLEAIGVLAATDNENEETQRIVAEKIGEIVLEAEDIAKEATSLGVSNVQEQGGDNEERGAGNEQDGTSGEAGSPLQEGAQYEEGFEMSAGVDVSVTTTSGVTTTPIVGTFVVGNEAQDIVDDIDETVSGLKEDISVLLEGKQLSQAVQKVKILSDAASDAEAMLVNVVAKEVQVLDTSQQTGESNEDGESGQDATDET